MPRPAYNINGNLTQAVVSWQDNYWGGCSSLGPHNAGSIATFKARKYITPAGISTRPWAYRDKWLRPTPWSVEAINFELPISTYLNVVNVPNAARCPPVTGPVVSMRQEKYTGCGFTSPMSNVPTGFDQSLVNRGTIDILNRIKNNGFEGVGGSLGLNLAQRKQSEDLLVSGMNKILNSYTAFKHARKGEFKKAMRVYSEREKRYGKRVLTRREATLLQLPNTWLEFQYGLLPTISDIHDAMVTVDKYQQLELYHFGVTSKVSNITKRISIPVASVGLSQNLVFTGDLWEGCKHRIDYNLGTNVLPQLSTLGLTNPVNFVWELLPYSFVVDWFLPLGNWFNTFDATIGKSFKAGTRTSSARLLNTYHTMSVPPGYQFVGYVVGGEPSMSLFRMNRVVLTSFPSAYPPTFKNPCSPAHVANALSLFVTGIARVRR